MEINAYVTQLIGLQELAKLWKVSPHTIRAWVRQGKLIPTRICRRLLFAPADCERFLKEQAAKSSR
jgi:DNA-binding transcriptional MerR regulator